jgi:peptidyl-prolyl cis-trans isomerase B (cyclophilin B)
MDAKSNIIDEVAVVATQHGTMVVEFWTDVAPKTVENFKKLAKQGFYDGTAFHRIIKGFMIQGGDPLTKDPSEEHRWGTGDPGYKIKAEFSKKKHVKGVLSMARSSHPDSAGSQFFICHGEASFLDGQYTCFGMVVKGHEVLDKLADVACKRAGEASPSRPIERQGVETVKIVERSSVK